MNRIMLVSSKPSEEVEKFLLATGCDVIKVDDGEAAIFQAQHAIFDMAIIVSTGKAMDLAETVFNLRDISRSMQIVVIAGGHGIDEGAEIIAHAAPNTRALTIDELPVYLGITASSAKRYIGKRQ
jgi:DNA-binding response OmpR family regulator